MMTAVYGIRVGDFYALRIWESTNSVGQQNIYAQTPSFENHIHGYVPGSASGSTIGCSLKDAGIGRGSAGVSAIVDAAPFAKAVVRKEGAGFAIELAARGPSSALTAGIVPLARTASQSVTEWISVDPPSGAGLAVTLNWVPSDYSAVGHGERLLDLPKEGLARVLVRIHPEPPA